MSARRFLVVLYMLVAATVSPMRVLAHPPSIRPHLLSLKTSPITLTVTREGIYRLSGTYLQSQGINSGAVDPSTLGLSDGGVPVPIYVSSTGPTFDPADFIEFYGHPVNNTYNSANVYLLSDTVSKPARVAITPIKTANSPASVAFGTFRDLRRVERWAAAPVAAPYTTSNAWPSDGDPHWYETSLEVGTRSGLPQALAKVVTFPAYGVTSTGGPCSLEVPVWGYTSHGKGPTYQHNLAVGITGRRGVVRAVPGSPFHWSGAAVSGVASFTVRSTFPCTWLTNNSTNPGLNQLTISTSLPRGSTQEQIIIRSVHVGYVRSLCAQDADPQPATPGTPVSATFENLPLYAGKAGAPKVATSYTVAGFTTAPQTMWRLTRGVATMLIGFHAVVTSGGTAPCGAGQYHISFGDTAPVPSRYFVTSAPLVPTSVTPTDPSNIKGGGPTSARYLLITHPSFASGLTPLVRYHQHQGLSVKVVGLNTIYDRFSDGQVNPEAIHAYVRYAHDHFGTQFVLLVGGDTYDYHNYYGCPSSGLCDRSNANNRSFLPSLYTSGPGRAVAAADTLFSTVPAGSGLKSSMDIEPQVAIGRLPVLSRAELKVEVTKSTHWAGWISHYRHTALYANGPSSRDRAASALMVLPGFHPTTYSQNGQTNHDRPLHNRFLNSFNRGQEIVNYVGEGSSQQLGRAALLGVQDVSALNNGRRPSMMVQWSTGTADYTSPKAPSLDSALLAATDSSGQFDGAALALGSTDAGHSPVDTRLAGIAPGTGTPSRMTAINGMQGFYDYLAAGYSAGVALELAKQDLLALHADASTVYTVNTEILLGDPALGLAGAPHSRLIFPGNPQVVHFNAASSASGVALSWAVAVPRGVRGYRLFRLTPQHGFRQIGPPTVTVVHYQDAGGRLNDRYRLQVLGSNGQVLATALALAH